MSPKVLKMAFLSLKMVKMIPLGRPKFVTQFWLWGYSSTFQAENIPKHGLFNAENNAQTTYKQLQKKFKKSKK